jgi:curli biogenesis system outer membrane secretion channel CsgG
LTARGLIVAAVMAACLLSVACISPKVAYNPRVDFSKIHRVGVTTFSGANGAAAADILTQDLVAGGIERQRLDAVLDEQRLAESGVLDPETAVKLRKILGIDAIIVGSVTSYSPGQSYLIQTDDADIRIGNGVTPVTGRNIYPGVNVLGLPNTQVVSTAAQVGLIARMVDVETGAVLWSARMNYEGLDAETAMATITSSFVKSLGERWPGIQVRR